MREVQWRTCPCWAGSVGCSLLPFSLSEFTGAPSSPVTAHVTRIIPIFLHVSDLMHQFRTAVGCWTPSRCARRPYKQNVIWPLIRNPPPPSSTEVWCQTLGLIVKRYLWMWPIKEGLLHTAGMSSINFFLFLRETFSYFNLLCLQYENKILDM